MNKNHTIVTTVIVVVVAGGAFFGGIKYAQSKTPQRSANGQFAQGANGGRALRRFGNGNDFVAGKIISKDANGITVQIMMGPGGNNASSTASGSRIIFLGQNTQIAKSVSGTPDDLSVGANVVVTGTDNSDGSITAQTVQIRPDIQNGQNAPMIPAGRNGG